MESCDPYLIIPYLQQGDLRLEVPVRLLSLKVMYLKAKILYVAEGTHVAEGIHVAEGTHAAESKMKELID